MAQAAQSQKSFIGGLFTWRNALLTAGVAIIAPYLVKRLMPFIDGRRDANANDVALAGKDAVRDAADGMDVGGVTGKIKRGVNRVADHVAH